MADPLKKRFAKRLSYWLKTNSTDCTLRGNISLLVSPVQSCFVLVASCFLLLMNPDIHLVIFTIYHFYLYSQRLIILFYLIFPKLLKPLNILTGPYVPPNGRKGPQSPLDYKSNE